MTDTEHFAHPPEGSPIEELHRHLAAHVAAEAEFMSSYQELLGADDTPEAARYLIRVVLEDEERHHRFFRELSAAIGNLVDWAHDPEATPSMAQGSYSQEFERATARFLAAEREDRKELRELRKRLRRFGDTTVWPLLVGLMEHDTEKHIELLTFLHEQAKRRKL